MTRFDGHKKIPKAKLRVLLLRLECELFEHLVLWLVCSAVVVVMMVVWWWWWYVICFFASLQHQVWKEKNGKISLILDFCGTFTLTRVSLGARLIGLQVAHSNLHTVTCTRPVRVPRAESRC